MSLISLSNAYLSFSDEPLLDYTELHIQPNERVCLVGRNGAGKSTLLKIINQEMTLDDGQVVFEQDLKVSRLQQDPPQNIQGTVFDFVAEGVEAQAGLLKIYHEISHQIEYDPSNQNLKKLADLQVQLDHHNIWQIDKHIHDVLNTLGLNAETALSSLSGGWLRKAALAKALVCRPDVLLLDEPTNHLDIDTITWLEDFLMTFSGSIVFISHDRSFIRRMATRIIDLDRGKLVSYPENYDHYLQEKQEALRVEALQNVEFDRRLAQEEVWIRQGIKARRTRNEGRVSALKNMRRERSERRQVTGSATLKIEEALRSGKIVFELEDVNYRIDNKQLVDHFTAQVMRGDNIALIGPNGCGKTTLLTLMLQQIQPDSGLVHQGANLEIAYFDQHRAHLDLEKTVMDNVAEGKQEITINGHTRHILSYLQDFLFPPKRARTPVKALSGGERNRLLLAKLFVKPSNVLILDEPTNDLDIETLELLEEKLADYQGTVLLVSHDRQFVDNTVTHCWIFEGNGIISNYIGGYYDAHRQRAMAKPFTADNNNKSSIKEKTDKKANKATTIEPITKETTTRKVKLTYQQTRELDNIPAQIEQLETQIELLQSQVNCPQFFEQTYELTAPILEELAAVQQLLEKTYQRWEYLDSIK